MASCESTGRELLFEWSHHRISSIDSKVRITLQNSIKHPGSERVNARCCSTEDRTQFGMLAKVSDLKVTFNVCTDGYVLFNKRAGVGIIASSF